MLCEVDSGGGGCQKFLLLFCCSLELLAVPLDFQVVFKDVGCRISVGAENPTSMHFTHLQLSDLSLGDEWAEGGEIFDRQLAGPSDFLLTP